MSRPDALAPTLTTMGVARKMIAAARIDRTPEAVLEHLPYVAPDQQLALLAYLVKLAASGTSHPTERIAREEAAYSDDDARRAHAAFYRGETDEWTRTGERVYNRRKARLTRARARQAQAAGDVA